MGLFSSQNSDGTARAAEFRLRNNPFFTAMADKTKGTDFIRAGASGPLLNLQRSLFSDSQQFADMATDNEAAELANLLGLEMLGGLDAFTPEDIMNQQFDLLSPQLLRQQEQDFLNLEGRLFSQGRLGSTGGSLDLGTLFQEQEDARRRLMAESLGLGLQSQAQQFNIGSGLLQLDPALRSAFSALSLGSLEGGLAIQDTATSLFGAIAAAQGAGVGGNQVKGQSLGSALGAGIVNAGIKAATGGIGSLFTPTSFSSTTVSV